MTFLSMKLKYNFSRVIMMFGLLGFLSACGGGSSSDGTDPEITKTTSISISIVDIPKPFRADGQWQMVYELVVDNTGETTVTLDALAVTSDNQSLLSIDAANIRTYALENTVTIQPNGLTAMFLWVESTNETAPLTLLNTISYTNSENVSFEKSFTLNLDQNEVTVLDSPMQGDGWKALNINNNAHHRRSFMMFNDQPKFAQRYAIDWVKVDDSGSWFSGNGTDNEEHYAYGEEVFASIEGEIVKVVNGYPDNIPGQLADESVPLAGNYVVLKTPQNEFILFAHFIADSILVKEGDFVSADQVIGLIGNSGNSSAPHLHFHLAKDIDLDSLSALNATGLPYHFEQFEITDGDQSAGMKNNEMPYEGAIIRFH